MSPLAGLSLLAASPALAATAQDVPRYGVFEVALQASGSYTNPYLQMPGDNTSPGFVYAVFTDPGGGTMQMDGFWDGGQTWRVRMAPTSTGTWTYRTYSTDAGLDGQTGSFNCVASGSHGFVHVDPAHPHHFNWDDGTPFLYAPVATMIAHFDNRDAQGDHRRIDDGTFAALIALRTSQGFDGAYWGYYGFNKTAFNDGTQANEGGPPFTSYNPDLLNPGYYQMGDQRIGVLASNGMLPMFTLGWPDQNILSMGTARLKRYWRYLVARYSAYNVVWNLFGEGDEFGSSYLSIMDDFADLTRRYDPYRHLLTTHLTGGPSSTLANRAWLDFITLQAGVSSTSSYLNYGKPVLNAEYGGYEDAGQATPDQLRGMIWQIRCRGGDFVYESWGNNTSALGAQYCQYNHAFFRDRTRYWLLEYAPSLFGGSPGLADPGSEYVTYLGGGGSVSVDLSAVAGSVQVTWYNPRTGSEVAGGSAAGQAVRSFTAPDGNDWVLHLGGGSVSDSLPPSAPQALRAR